jgi:hypothetical protein
LASTTAKSRGVGPRQGTHLVSPHKAENLPRGDAPAGDANYPAARYARGTLESGGEQQRTRKKGTGTVYRIVVRSELSRRYAAAFEGMDMQTKTGLTILTGEVNQPYLHGIFERINGLGLELLSVESRPEGSELVDSGGDGAAAPHQSPWTN